MTRTEVVCSTSWPTQVAVAFPGRYGSIALPLHRRLARSGVAAYTASRSSVIVAQWVAFGVVATVGPRLLGRPQTMACPVDEGAWLGLADQWRSDLGRFDSVVILKRRQPDRSGWAVLLHRAGRRVAFVKARPSGHSLEPALLTTAARLRPQSFRVPQLLAEGSFGQWDWFAAEPLPAVVHRPGRPDVVAVADEATAIVEATMPRPQDVPAHWAGAHGDLTPWNLRRSAGSFVVFDWEDAGYAPPGTDLVSYVAAAATLRSGRSSRSPEVLVGQDTKEAVRYCLMVARERGSSSDAGYRKQLVSTLEAMRGTVETMSTRPIRRPGSPSPQIHSPKTAPRRSH